MFLFQVLKLYSGSGKRDKYYLTMTSLFFHLFKRINKQFSVEKIGLLCPWPPSSVVIMLPPIIDCPTDDSGVWVS